MAAAGGHWTKGGGFQPAGGGGGPGRTAAEQAGVRQAQRTSVAMRARWDFLDQTRSRNLTGAALARAERRLATLDRRLAREEKRLQAASARVHAERGRG